MKLSAATRYVHKCFSLPRRTMYEYRAPVDSINKTSKHDTHQTHVWHAKTTSSSTANPSSLCWPATTQVEHQTSWNMLRQATSYCTRFPGMAGIVLSFQAASCCWPPRAGFCIKRTRNGIYFLKSSANRAHKNVGSTRPMGRDHTVDA